MTPFPATLTRRTHKLLAALAILACAAVAQAGTDADARARAFLDGVDDLYRGETSHGTITMRIKTAHWSRELKVESWSKGKDRSLMRILSPKKEKGTATLRVEKNIWNYLPKVGRVIKIPSSMMGGSWMGSHFTNDDLVRESRMADDFDFSVTFEGKRDGKEVVEITCLAREEAAVVWGKIVVEVTPAKIPLRMRYFDEDMVLARTMTFGDVKKIGERMLPTVMLVQPADKPEEHTEVIYDDLTFGVALPDDFFSLRTLKR